MVVFGAGWAIADAVVGGTEDRGWRLEPVLRHRGAMRAERLGFGGRLFWGVPVESPPPVPPLASSSLSLGRSLWASAF